jgi:hypothetical protein
VQKHKPPLRFVVAAAVIAMLVLARPPSLKRYQRKGRETLTAQTSVLTAMKKLRALEKSPNPQRVVLDYHACHVFRYYRDYHSNARDDVGAWIRAHTIEDCSPRASQKKYLRKLDAVAATGASFWVMTARGPFMKQVPKRLAPHCDVPFKKRYRGTLLYRCVAKDGR